jgi:hypothetical protein
MRSWPLSSSLELPKNSSERYFAICSCIIASSNAFQGKVEKSGE